VEPFDLVIIGAGAAGEAAAFAALDRGARVAIVDRDLFGGSCPFWACLPSKTLLHAAGVHALGGDYPWSRAAARRDWMINRESLPYPSDAGHVRRLVEAGAEVVRGSARVAGPGRVAVAADGGERELAGRSILVAVGTRGAVPDIPGLEGVAAWSNREATSARELPRSLLVLGSGPSGIELAQVYARYGVPTTIVARRRLNAKDHARNSAALADGLTRDGVDVRLGVEPVRVDPGAGGGGAHAVRLSDGSSATGHEILLAVGRVAQLDGLGLETIGVDLHGGRVRPDDQLRIAPGVFVAGDPAGPEMHTHLAHYQGELVARIALGEDVRPDYRAIPRATYTDPETAGVGLTVEEAQRAGLDAFEQTADLATTARGYVADAAGHASIVVDRGSRTIVGAFIAGPGASEAIHLAVLAVKTRTALDVLADTIAAFPTTSRVLAGTFPAALRALDGGVARPGMPAVSDPNAAPRRAPAPPRAGERAD
jgi:pyruvate/2-oxoglutarate dehydrogenase complex dihydrolipoamide dehydrogenase (E3) component